MAYVFLLLAISSDVFASSLLKSTVGLTRFWPTAAVLTGYVLSFRFPGRVEHLGRRRVDRCGQRAVVHEQWPDATIRTPTGPSSSGSSPVTVR